MDLHIFLRELASVKDNYGTYRVDKLHEKTNLKDWEIILMLEEAQKQGYITWFQRLSMGMSVKVGGFNPDDWNAPLSELRSKEDVI